MRERQNELELVQLLESFHSGVSQDAQVSTTPQQESAAAAAVSHTFEHYNHCPSIQVSRPIEPLAADNLVRTRRDIDRIEVLPSSQHIADNWTAKSLNELESKKNSTVKLVSFVQIPMKKSRGKRTLLNCRLEVDIYWQRKISAQY